MPDEVFRTHNGQTNAPTFLGRANWDKHVSKHPEIKGRELHVRQVVEDPDIVVQDEYDVIYKYIRGDKVGRSRHLYLLAIEESFADPEYCVVSCYFTEHIRPGRFLRVRF
ncbi:MAG: hypothetical protein HY678_04095 [Chloroflexi bacterium]|nr:hypothetical protein [Chloroflexota bacterium]